MFQLCVDFDWTSATHAVGSEIPKNGRKNGGVTSFDHPTSSHVAVIAAALASALAAAPAAVALAAAPAAVAPAAVLAAPTAAFPAAPHEAPTAAFPAAPTAAAHCCDDIVSI